MHNNNHKSRSQGKPRRGTGQRQSNQKSSGKSSSKGDGPQWRKATKTFAFWIAIIGISLLVSQQLAFHKKGVSEISYNDFKALLEENNVKKAVIEGYRLRGTLKSPRPVPDKPGLTFQNFTVGVRDINIETANAWVDKYGIELVFKDRSQGLWGYASYLLPWLLLIVFWVFLLRRMQGGGTKSIFSFGKSRAKLLTENHLKVTFDDVAGADEAKQELLEIIEFLKEPDKFQKLGGKIPKGALLLGPPGTGKTLLAKAVAGEADVPFFSMSGADFVEMFVGVGASRVRDLFEQGKKSAPCIIFIDELDAVGRHRGAGLGGGHDEREQTLNQLLVEMDGFESNEGVILIAATNRPDVLDHALLRPGRFDRQIIVDRPDIRGREGILKVHTKNIRMDKKTDLSVLAKGTPGFSGADIANMVNEAALLAARKNKKLVTGEDFEEAKDKVLMGTERRSLLISDEEKRNTAYHESGHVLIAKLLPNADPVHKVTIIPRGRALGATTTLPIDEKHNYSKSYCLTALKQLLGGRAAEKIVLGELTTGAGDDIKRATELVRKMVCEWGMSEKLGPLTFGEKREEIFLGREIAQHRDYSEKTAQIIDQEVTRIVVEADEEVERLLRNNIEKLHYLAEALLEHEILDGNEVDTVLAGEKLDPVKTKDQTALKSVKTKRKRSKVKVKNIVASPAIAPATG